MDGLRVKKPLNMAISPEIHPITIIITVATFSTSIKLGSDKLLVSRIKPEINKIAKTRLPIKNAI